MTCDHEHEDGAYLLGALSPEDRMAYERHLRDCAECTRAVSELAGLPGLLARVPTEQVAADPAPPSVPETLLPQLVRRMQARRRRRALVTTGLVAAAAAAIVGVGVSMMHDESRPDPSSTAAATDPAPASGSIAPAVAMRSVAQDPVSATLSLTSAGWGTRLELTCDERQDAEAASSRSSAASAGSDEWASYAMYVYSVDGRSQQVATWRAVPGGVVHVSGATATRRGDITEVVVRNAGGVPVLDLAR